MRLPINLFAKKDVDSKDESEDNPQNKMDSEENNNRINDVNSDIVNNNSNTNDDNLNNNDTNHRNSSNISNNNSNNNSNKNIMASILGRIMPPLTAFRNQSIQHLHRSQSVRYGRSDNSCDNFTTTTISTTNNINSHPSTESTLPSTSENKNSISNATDFSSVKTSASTTTAFKYEDSFLEDSSDLDNDNDVDKRRSWRKSLTRSDSTPSLEDSGFSSSNCLSDEKDDVSINNNNFDCEDIQPEEIPKRDSFSSAPHLFPLSSMTVRARARTFSMDSTSSDQSDTNTSSPTTSSSRKTLSKLSSSLPLLILTPHVHCDRSDNGDENHNRIRTMSCSANAKTPSVGVGVGAPKRRSFRLKNRRAASGSKSGNDSGIVDDACSPSTIPVLPQAPQLDANESGDEETDEGDNDDVLNDTSDLNNNRPDFTCKNLSSCVDAAVPFRFTDLFRCHGLLTLVACVLYTLVLLFVCGVLALSWNLLKKLCLNKSDLKDLRGTLLESRRRREIVTSPTSDLDGGS